MKILGIDYGTKRIGVAVSDDDGRLAFPKIVLQNDNKLIENLRGIIETDAIKTVVIGESKNYKMIDNDIMVEILDLKDILEKEIEVDVVFESEVMTSVQAEKTQKSLGGDAKMLDASAAAIILQSYLDSKKQHEHTCKDDCCHDCNSCHGADGHAVNSCHDADNHDCNSCH